MSEKERGNIVIKEIPHVSDEIMERFRVHEVAKISDGFAKYGTLRPEIKPLRDGMHMCGQAVTVKCAPGDLSALELAAEAIVPGNVVVVAAGEQDNIAFADEYIGKLLKAKGAAGLVVDGAVRDESALVENGMPVYARCTNNKRYNGQGEVSINIPVNCGGLVVNPGDIIVGDDDGVVAVPYYDAERALALADKKVAGEERLQGIIDGGARFTDLAKCDDKIAVWRE